MKEILSQTANDAARAWSVNMKKYRVYIRGENFLINLGGVNQKVGFYTTRFVEAQNEDEAELVAIEALRSDPKLREVVLNEKSDSPMIYAEEITELTTFDGYRVPGTGLAFYTEEGE